MSLSRAGLINLTTLPYICTYLLFKVNFLVEGLCHINFKLGHYNAFLLKGKKTSFPRGSAKLEGKLPVPVSFHFDLFEAFDINILLCNVKIGQVWPQACSIVEFIFTSNFYIVKHNTAFQHLDVNLLRDCKEIHDVGIFCLYSLSIYLSSVRLFTIKWFYWRIVVWQFS